MLVTHALHHESSGFGSPALELRVAVGRVWQWAHEKLAQRTETVRSDVLREAESRDVVFSDHHINRGLLF